MRRRGTQNLCSGTTQRDRVEREKEGDSGWGANMYTCSQFIWGLGKQNLIKYIDTSATKPINIHSR